MTDKQLFRQYLELTQLYNADGTWWNIKNKVNKVEHLIHKVRSFINNNPRLRKHVQLLQEDYKGIIRKFKFENSTSKTKPIQPKIEG